MGNTALTRKVDDLSKEPLATAGHLQLWQVRDGKRKETEEDVSVWTFDKTDLSKKDRRGGPIKDKDVIEAVYQLMLKDMKTLEECKGSPGTLQMIEIVEEGKNALVFLTEPIVCSLQDSLCNFDNIPNGPSLHKESFEANGAISEMEISRGVCQVVEALQSLHTRQGRLHCNLTPESVVVTCSGHWKLCGFGFSLESDSGGSGRTANPYFKEMPEQTTLRMEPDLRYCGLEITEGGLNPSSIRYISAAQDIFSLGIIAFELYRYSLRLAKDRRRHMCITPMSNNNPLDHPAALESMYEMDMTFLPPGLPSLLQGMIAQQPHQRMSSHDIGNDQFFNSGPLAVLRTVDTLGGKDAHTQGEDLLALSTEIDGFPARMLVGVVLPAVNEATGSNPALWVHALPLYEAIAMRVECRQEFAGAAESGIEAGLAVQNPVETMAAFLRHMTFLQKYFDGIFFSTHVVGSLFVNCLDKKHSGLSRQVMAVLCEEEVRDMVDQSSLLASIVPCVCKHACKSSEVEIKLHALYLLSLLMPRLGEEYVAANILPSLKYITETDKSPDVCVVVVGIYSSISDALGPEYIARSILPALQPLLVDKSLDADQFKMIANLTQSLMMRVLDTRCAAIGVAKASLAVGGAAPSAQEAFASVQTLVAATKNGIATGAPPMPTKRLSMSSAVPPPPPSSAAPQSLPPPPSSAAPPLPFGSGGSNSNASPEKKNAGIFGIDATSGKIVSPRNGSISNSTSSGSGGSGFGSFPSPPAGNGNGNGNGNGGYNSSSFGSFPAPPAGGGGAGMIKLAPPPSSSWGSGSSGTGSGNTTTSGFGGSNNNSVSSGGGYQPPSMMFPAPPGGNGSSMGGMGAAQQQQQQQQGTNKGFDDLFAGLNMGSSNGGGNSMGGSSNSNGMGMGGGMSMDMGGMGMQNSQGQSKPAPLLAPPPGGSSGGNTGMGGMGGMGSSQPYQQQQSNSMGGGGMGGYPSQQQPTSSSSSSFGMGMAWPQSQAQPSGGQGQYQQQPQGAYQPPQMGAMNGNNSNNGMGNGMMMGQQQQQQQQQQQWGQPQQQQQANTNPFDFLN